MATDAPVLPDVKSSAFRLKARLAEHIARSLDEAWRDLKRAFPLPEGFTYAVSANGDVEVFVVIDGSGRV